MLHQSVHSETLPFLVTNQHADSFFQWKNHPLKWQIKFLSKFSEMYLRGRSTWGRRKTVVKFSRWCFKRALDCLGFSLRCKKPWILIIKSFLKTSDSVSKMASSQKHRISCLQNKYISSASLICTAFSRVLAWDKSWELLCVIVQKKKSCWCACASYIDYPWICHFTYTRVYMNCDFWKGPDQGLLQSLPKVYLVSCFGSGMCEKVHSRVINCHCRHLKHKWSLNSFLQKCCCCSLFRQVLDYCSVSVHF